ncbi:MAG: hypothetical protein ACLP2F_02835 [Steroidobacteraceae bacterium]
MGILRVTASTAGAMLLLTGAGIAQTPLTSPPNETDVHAAYCIEVIKYQIRLGESILASQDKNTVPGAAAAAPSEAIKANIDTQRATLRKLNLYLLPRLVDLDQIRIAGAKSTAKDDLARFNSAMSACQSQCPMSPGFDAGALRKCAAECATRAMPDFATIQMKLESCQDLQWLPSAP